MRLARYLAQLSLLSLVLAPQKATADMADSVYVRFKDLGKKVQLETKGIAFLMARYGGSLKMRTYRKGEEGFHYDKTLHIRKDTLPICGSGCLKDDRQSWRDYFVCRYPVVDKDGDFIQLVLNSSNDKRGWIKIKETKRSMSLTLVMFTAERFPSWFAVDLFYFTHSGKRKLYSQPSRDSKYRVISVDDYAAWRVFTSTLRQKDGFLEVAIRSWDEIGKPSDKPIGWVRLRDDEGKNMIWFTYHQIVRPD